MFYKLLVSFSDSFSLFNVFKYITFRAFAAFLTTFAVAYFIGPRFIEYLKRKNFGQVVRSDGPQSHMKKTGTPTMGGLLMLTCLIAPTLLWFDLMNPLVWATISITCVFGSIGYVDDWLKVSKKNTKGLPGRLRLLLEFSFSGAVIAWLIYSNHFSTILNVPFFKSFTPDLGYGYVVFASFVIVGCANAVNLTDGLDGLATAPFVVAATTYGIFAYLAGNYKISEYLQIAHVPGAGELVPLAAAFVAAGLGFLWFNAYPAQVFMGDVGSLSLGGFLGVLAVLTKNEILLVLVGGVFVVEALSVITQVASFKLTGKRVFKMAPIHHHFELKGIEEPKVIVRFWILSIILAVLSLSTLKLR